MLRGHQSSKNCSFIPLFALCKRINFHFAFTSVSNRMFGTIVSTPLTNIKETQRIVLCEQVNKNLLENVAGECFSLF